MHILPNALRLIKYYMKETYLFGFNLSFAGVPVWYIVSSGLRIKRHWNDGREQDKVTIRVTLVLKCILCTLMVMLSFLQFILVLRSEDYEDVKDLKLVSFPLFFLSWIMSTVMLIFEVRNKIVAKLHGHLLYWLLNLIVYALLLYIETTYHDNSFLEYLYTSEILADAAGIVICSILLLLIFIKPNEFSNTKDAISASLLKKCRISVGYRNSMPEDRGLAGAVIVSIKDYKLKVDKGKQTIFYNITIRVKGDTYKIRKTYKDFDKLYKSIRNSFPLGTFPYMSFPSFPIFAGTSLTMDEKTLALNDFLKSLCCPEFMTEETLDFLNIQGSFREKLSEEHQEITESEKCINISETEAEHTNSSFVSSSKISVFEKSSKSHTNLHTYFEARLEYSEVSNNTDYAITWAFSDAPAETTVHRRYGDFVSLNSAMKKAVSPAVLPRFPVKTYVQNLRKADSQAVEIRRRKLEKYLCHVANDPAFHCQELLDFLECSIDINHVWGRRSNVEYEVVSPIGWEGELDGTSSYIVYILNFNKFVNSLKVNEWTIKRTFKDFEFMDAFLSKRMRSPLLLMYLKFHKEGYVEWPKLPSKYPVSLNNPSEIEKCRSEIESYLDEVCLVPCISQAYAFKCFIDDSDPNF